MGKTKPIAAASSLLAFLVLALIVAAPPATPAYPAPAAPPLPPTGDAPFKPAVTPTPRQVGVILNLVTVTPATLTQGTSATISIAGQFGACALTVTGLPAPLSVDAGSFPLSFQTPPLAAGTYELAVSPRHDRGDPSCTGYAKASIVVSLTAPIAVAALSAIAPGAVVATSGTGATITIPALSALAPGLPTSGAGATITIPALSALAPGLPTSGTGATITIPALSAIAPGRAANTPSPAHS